MLAWQLRAQFARRLSEVYRREVPAYQTLIDVTQSVNRDVISELGQSAQRLGNGRRVAAERHGAIRVGTRDELAEVARVLAAMGMHPVGFYDLRDDGIPVVSTAFRPVDPVELTNSPFRMFTSVLTEMDGRFFSRELAARVQAFLGRRRLFPPRLLALAERAGNEGGLDDDAAKEFLDLATDAFRLSAEPVDRDWYNELDAVSPVAADIAGVSSTHINHLTPRVLDIDELYVRLQARGLTMIPEIQGPPRWSGPDILLRQTSFRALAEQRRFRDTEGNVMPGKLQVRFGEVEARGVAVTERGRDRYEAAVAETDARLADQPGRPRADLLREVWAEHFPASESELFRQGLGVYTVTVDRDHRRDGRPPTGDISDLLDAGYLTAHPVVYEDFLPRSAAGIFRSNLSRDTDLRADDEAIVLDAGWLEAALDRTLLDPDVLYQAEHNASVKAAAAALGVQVPTA